MKSKKAISYFLFLLFSLVILFPGYGQSVSKSKQHSVEQISWANVLKKCLSTGINGIVEEERSSEEEDGNAAVCDFILPDLHPNLKLLAGLINHTQRDDLHTNYSAEIICPPPNDFLVV